MTRANLLAQIANPVGPQNVLAMFQAGQQDRMADEEFGMKRRRANALLAAGIAAQKGNYREASSLALGAGDSASAKDFITLDDLERQETERRELQASLFGPPSGGQPMASPAGGYRGPIGGDGRPRMPQPATQLRPSREGHGNRALATALWQAGDYDGAARAMYEDNRTQDQRDYEFDVSQGYTGTRRQWELEAKRAGANSVTVDMKGLTAEEEAAGKERGARMDLLESGKSIGNLQQIQLAGKLLQNIDSGALAGMKGTAGNIFASLGLPMEGLRYLGIDPNIVTTGPQIQALINRQVVGMIGSGQFPAQNFSDTDRIFLEQILPSLTNRPEANALITATTERLLSIEVQKRQAWAEARRTGVTFRDFETQWNDRLQGQDIFGDIARQAGNSQTSNEGWTDLPDGNRIRRKGQ
jgi:hypothetical protein